LNKTTIIKDYYYFKDEILVVMVMVFNATLNNIPAIIVAVSFIGGGNWSTQGKPPTFH
jgi:hypothetical protein